MSCKIELGNVHVRLYHAVISNSNMLENFNLKFIYKIQNCMTQPNKVSLEVELNASHDSMGEQTNLEPLQSLSLAGSIWMPDASILYKEPNSSQSVSFKL